MKQARASSQTRRLKVLGLLGLPILAIVVTVMVLLASFLTQPSTVHAADTEGVVIDQSPSVDTAIADVNDVGLLDSGITNTLAVVDISDGGNDPIGPDSAIAIGTDNNIIGLPSPSIATTPISNLWVIGTVLLSIMFVATVVTIIRRLSSSTTSPPTSETVTTFRGLQDGERRRDTQASSVSASSASPTSPAAAV